MQPRPLSLVLLLPVLAALLASCQHFGGASPPAADALFPPEGVDHLSMTVSVEVDLPGIGKDRVELAGTVVVHRSGPMGPDGKSMKGELVSASLQGNSPVFGKVIGIENPVKPSACEYTCEGPGRYPGHFDINGWFWLPERDLLISNERPVRVSGVAAGIPAVGQEAESSADDIPLQDIRKPQAGTPIGFLSKARGKIIALVNLEEHLKKR